MPFNEGSFHIAEKASADYKNAGELISVKFDNKNPEKFIENNFSRTEKRVEREGSRYKLIEFRPKDEKTKEWIKERTFYLFGGNGNTAADRSMPKEKFQEYAEENFSNGRILKAELEANPQEVVVKTGEALNSISGFLREIGKEDLINYYTSTLCGENGAYAAKKKMESGEDMEEKTAEMMNRKNAVWITSQLSPYTSYISTIFLRRDISEMEEWKDEFDESFKELVGKNRLDFVKLDISEEKTIRKAKHDNMLGVDVLRGLHALIYSKQGNLCEPIEVINNELTNFKDEKYLFGDNRYAFSLMKIKDKNIYSGDASFGWSVPDRTKMSDITDFAMITGKEFYEEGIVRFMLVEH